MRFKSVLMVLLMLFATAVPSLVNAAGPTLDIGSVSGTPGQQVTVPITLTNNGASIASLSVDIGFNSSQLSVPMNAANTAPLAATRGVAITVVDENGDPIKSIAQSIPSAGVLRLGISGNNNTAIGDGVVVNVKFNVAASASGTLTLTNLPGAASPAAANVVITGAPGTITLPAAATAPGTPTIGTVTAGNTQATVNFTAPASNGGSAITGYTVTSSPGGRTATGTTSPLTVTGLTNGTAYTFTVTATNAVGTSAASSASSSVTPLTVPGAPTIGAATAGNAQATISFTAPASNGGSAITGYTVTSSPGGITATGAASPLTVNGLTNGTAYTFTVTATNAGGTSAASSATNSVTPKQNQTIGAVTFTPPTVSVGGTTTVSATATSALPVTFTSTTPLACTVNGATVTALTASACTIAADQAGNGTYNAATQVTGSITSGKQSQTIGAVTFTPPTVSVGGTTTVSATATSGLPVTFTSTTPSACTVNGATVTTLTAAVCTIAADQAGNGTYNAATQVTGSITPAVAVPGAPTIGTATAGNAQATISFTAPASSGGGAITNYTVTSSPGGKTATGTTSPLTVTGLTNGTAYTFTVTATNAAGTSTASAASNGATPQAAVPTAPSAVTATPGNKSASISFTAPNDSGSAITGYTVTSSPGGKTATGTTSPITVTDLTNGTAYTFTVTATNAKGAGPASAASNSVTPSELTPVIGAPSVTIAKTGISVTFPVTYTAATITLAPSHITVNKTGTANGTAEVSGTGTTTRTVTISGITGDGTLGISIAAGSATAGSITASPSAASSTFTVDNTLPVLAVTALANNATTSSNTLNITGTASDANGIKTVAVNGHDPATLTDGAFNTAVTLTSGANTITVVATDTAGNQKTDTRTINYDGTALVITLTSPTPADQSFTNQQSATITGTLNKPGSVAIKVGTSAPVTVATSGANNSFTTTVPVTLALGPNTISVLASDTVSPPNTATAQRSVTFDNAAPALAITDPAAAITTTYSSYKVKGTMTDNFNGAVFALSVDGVPVTPAPTVGSDGTFQQSVSFTSGKTYNITASATDLAGNATTVQRNIVFKQIGLADALRALQIAAGISQQTADDAAIDIAPLVNNVPTPDGVVDVSDAVVLLQKTVGLLSW